MPTDVALIRLSKLVFEQACRGLPAFTDDEIQKLAAIKLQVLLGRREA